MARPLRIEYPGAVYHLTSRGNRQEAIYLDDNDRIVFLAILGKTVTQYNWVCHGYCLMGNHYHLLIETPDANLSMGMRQLNGMYTQYSNRRYGRVGHVFQGRFTSVLVEKKAHLLELCRYIVLNPVRAGMCSHPRQWRWSSYRSIATGEKVPEFLSTAWILAQFAREKKRARKLYDDFVQQGTKNEDNPWEKLQGQAILGSELFVEKVKRYLGSCEFSAEIPKKQRLIGRPPIDGLIPVSIRKEKGKRNAAMVKAHLQHGYTLKEIAESVGIHYTTVSKAISASLEQSKKR